MNGKKTQDHFNNVATRYGFYFDRYGFLHTRCISKEELFVRSNQVNKKNVSSKNCAVWLRFIVLFWSPRVMRAALKFGLAAMIMNKYERLGFAIMILCFAL